MNHSIAKPSISTLIFLLSAPVLALLGWGILSAILIGFAAVQILNQTAGFFSGFGARLIHWIHAMAFEGFAFATTFLSHPFRYWQRPVGAKEGRPLLLVHGYVNDSCVWLYHKRMLALRKLGPIYSINLGHPFRSIRHYAAKVQLKIADIVRETGRKDLILVGHSMGGLVCSLAALPGMKVITIGSPLKGAPLARIGIGPNAREMEPGSHLLKEIEKKITSSPEISFYHIATKSDQLVIPFHSALVNDNPERQFILEDIGHQSLLFSKRVSHKLAEWSQD